MVNVDAAFDTDTEVGVLELLLEMREDYNLLRIDLILHFCMCCSWSELLTTRN
jgi:hypothetical protein